MKRSLSLILIEFFLLSCSSPDNGLSPGSTWTARTLPSSAYWSSVTYGNSVFVAVAGGPSNTAATSP